MSKNKIKKFWDWAKDETDERVLRFEGVIAEDSWFDDLISPKLFRDELFAENGDVTIYINSPGGDCIAASQIYTMLLEYSGNVTVKIDALAASAATVIAMAGNSVLMSPTAMFMIHNPMTLAIGDSQEMRKAQEMLNEVKESILNAYHLRTKQPRAKLSNWMDAETWMNANKAKEWGFIDGLLEGNEPQSTNPNTTNFVFSRRAVTNSLLDKLKAKALAQAETAEEPAEPPAVVPQTPAPNEPEPQSPAPTGVCAESLSKRLSLIPHQNLTQRR